MSIVVGIDPHATRAAAVGLHLDGSLAFRVDNMKMTTGEDVREWQADAREFVRQVVARAAAIDCDVIGFAIEDVFGGPNQKVALNHAKAIGSFVAIACRQVPHALVEVVPSRVARRLVGIQKAGKASTREWAEARFPGLVGASEDVLDAAMLATALLAQVEVLIDVEPAPGPLPTGPLVVIAPDPEGGE